MKEYTYNNAIIRVHGVARHETVKASTINFLKKVETYNKKRKGNHQNGNTNTSRNI